MVGTHNFSTDAILKAYVDSVPGSCLENNEKAKQSHLALPHRFQIRFFSKLRLRSLGVPTGIDVTDNDQRNVNLFLSHCDVVCCLAFSDFAAGWLGGDAWTSFAAAKVQPLYLVSFLPASLSYVRRLVVCYFYPLVGRMTPCGDTPILMM
jgi:hypothetical protein